MSELGDWPPYANCAAPLSPQARRRGGTFTVPAPYEFHFRRLRRLLIAPAAEEDMDEGAGVGLVDTPIPRGPLNRATSPSGNITTDAILSSNNFLRRLLQYFVFL